MKSNQKRGGGGGIHHHHRHAGKDPSMTVIITRAELFDDYTATVCSNFKTEQNQRCQQQQHHQRVVVEPYSFEWNESVNRRIRKRPEVQILHVNNTSLLGALGVSTKSDDQVNKAVLKKDDVPNPYPDVHDKYWSQRHRLFSRFDEGVQLDAEGWYSITPEIIADHVATKLGSMAYAGRYIFEQTTRQNEKICILEAFCGCGGNAIAFGRCSSIDLTICIDIDRSKLRKAAHNAKLYGIAPDKIIFIEANALTVLECYRNGQIITEMRDKYLARNIHHRLMMSMMSSKSQHSEESIEGYIIGGVELLPSFIDGVHIDPPWGGMDYGTKGSYDLTRNLFISANDDKHQAFNMNSSVSPNEDAGSMDGRRLLSMSARASNVVVYSLPRNTSKACIGQAALHAGYRGNAEYEQQFINGRLKCVSAYFGRDSRPLDMLGGHSTLTF